MSGLVLGPQALDSTRDYALDLSGPPSAPSLLGVFDGTESLRVRIWPGEDSPVAITLAAIWDPALAGNPASVVSPRVKLTVPTSALAGIDPGTYPIEGTVNPGTDDVPLLPPGSTITFTDAPGTAAATRVYCSAQDLRDACPWIDAVRLPSDLAGFLDAREAASLWFEDLLHRHARGPGSLGAEMGLRWYRRTGARNWWLQERLDAGNLLVRPEIKRACALHAVGVVLTSRIGAMNDTSYQVLGARYLGMADDLACTITAELDVNADGRGDYAIDLGWIDAMRG